MYISSATMHTNCETVLQLLCNFSWWAVTRRTLPNHKTVKIGGWAFAGDNTTLFTVGMATCTWAVEHAGVFLLYKVN